MYKRYVSLIFETLLNAHEKRGKKRFFLLPMSQVFKIWLRVRHFFYKKGLFQTHSAELPVICVGSVFVGGSGKTPFVRLLMEHLPKEAYVLTRGYKTIDEPLFFQNCVVEKDRVKGAKYCLEKGAKIIVMDDGLQHLRLKKDLKIAVLSKEQVEKGWDLLPAGSLRDLPHVLEDVEYIVLHEMDTLEDYHQAKNRLQKYKKPVFIGSKTEFAGFYTMDGIPVDKVQKAILLSGISRPHRFREMVEKKGVLVLEHHLLEDHGKLSFEELERLLHRAESLGASLIMTEKDAVKYPYFTEAIQAKVQTRIVFDEENFNDLIGRIHETMD
jgi:tetraacyldisaccharide 4'-kinase